MAKERHCRIEGERDLDMVRNGFEEVVQTRVFSKGDTTFRVTSLQNGIQNARKNNAVESSVYGG
jgi:hypothetical protein